jgi:hypothetical protein
MILRKIDRFASNATLNSNNDVVILGVHLLQRIGYLR